MFIKIETIITLQAGFVIKNELGPTDKNSN
jgi:hypothetical protein